MKNIHILPTDKPSRLYLFKGRLILGDLVTVVFKNSGAINQHIYITSDEEIKVGDWFLPQGHINPHKLKEYNKINGDLESYNGLCYDISKCKKIILTTDQDLIKDGVQAIDDEFLEWFVKNPSCEGVEAKLIEEIPSGFTFGMFGNDEPPTELVYKIIIPKEEPKQETLEEAAESYWVKQPYNEDAFIEGAKWQAERMYSEQEAYAIWKAGKEYWRTSGASITFEELLEQFKKK